MRVFTRVVVPCQNMPIWLYNWSYSAHNHIFAFSFYCYTRPFLSWRQTATSVSFGGAERCPKPVKETSRSWYDVGLSTVAVRLMHTPPLQISHHSLTSFLSFVPSANRSCRARKRRKAAHPDARQPDLPGSARARVRPGRQACHGAENDGL
jgi:hypothetical protein